MRVRCILLPFSGEIAPSSRLAIGDARMTWTAAASGESSVANDAPVNEMIERANAAPELSGGGGMGSGKGRVVARTTLGM